MSAMLEERLFREAIGHFNRADFFEAHEAWEDVWRAAPGAKKKFLQGLIQIAVALHHYKTGNVVGARSLLRRGRHNLSGYPEDFGGIRLGALLESVKAWEHALAEERPAPAWPKVQIYAAFQDAEEKSVDGGFPP